MMQKPIIPRELANQDVDNALAYYLEEQAEKAALGFVDALERAYKQISRHPASGSARYTHALDLPGLRFWPLQRYPYLVFYVERDEHIDVWRILHESNDIATWMRDA